VRLLPVTGAAGLGAAARVASSLRAVPATAAAAAYLQRTAADAVLAVGGYASVPGALAAGMLGVPLLIQEQNALPGVANRLLAPWASLVACGFESAVAAFPSLPARFTGNPIRDEFFAVGAPPASPPAVLVLGGSQGSLFLNRVIPEAFRVLARERELPRIVHQAGLRWEADLRDRYATLGVPATVVPFLERPADALSESTLVIARAGALTVCELAAARRAALLIPFAAAAHDHQTRNAEALAATGAARVLAEKEARAETVAAVLGSLLEDREALVERGRKGAGLAPRDAASAIASLVLARAGVPVAAAAHDHARHAGDSGHGGRA
ncbi:MAG: glycosyltransferase, partial [Acidobacteriota bacterium]